LRETIARDEKQKEKMCGKERKNKHHTAVSQIMTTKLRSLCQIVMSPPEIFEDEQSYPVVVVGFKVGVEHGQRNPNTSSIAKMLHRNGDVDIVFESLVLERQGILVISIAVFSFYSLLTFNSSS
jgi:hypothetical protein